jgi:hypothetical protein
MRIFGLKGKEQPIKREVSEIVKKSLPIREHFSSRGVCKLVSGQQLSFSRIWPCDFDTTFTLFAVVCPSAWLLIAPR